MHAVGFYEAWVNRVDTNFARPKFLRKRPRYTVHRRLSRSVNGSTRGRNHPCYRAYIYNAASILAKMLRRLFRSQQQTKHVEIEQSVEVIVRNIFQRQKLINSGVVDQNVELAVSFFCFRE